MSRIVLPPPSPGVLARVDADERRRVFEQDQSIAAYRREFRRTRREARGLTDDMLDLLLLGGGDGGAGFNPIDLDAKLAGYLRLDTRTDTGTLTIEDLVNVGNTATQATASLKPTFSTANGYDTMVCDGVNDYVRWTTAGNILNTSRCGFSFWFRILTPPTGTETVFATRADNRHLTLTATSSDFAVTVLGDTPSTSVQVCTVSTALGTGWRHAYIGYDGTQPTDTDRVQIWLDGVEQAFVDTNSVGGDFIPSTIRVSTASDWGARNSLAACHVEFGDVFAHANAYLTGTEVGNMRAFEPRDAI